MPFKHRSPERDGFYALHRIENLVAPSVDLIPPALAGDLRAIARLISRAEAGGP